MKGWALPNSMKCNVSNCQVLHLGWGNRDHVHTLGDEGLGSN